MEKIKAIVDREPVSSDYIEAKQDFGNVLSQVKNLKPPVWKTAWFYGPVGMAVVAVVVSATTINPVSELPSESAINLVPDKIMDQLNQPESLTKIQVASINEQENYQNELPGPSKEKPQTTERTLNVETIDNHKEQLKTAEEVVLPIVEKKLQEEVVPKKKNMFPHIDGYFKGEIPISVLNSENGIQLNDDITIVAFDIHYESLNGTESAAIVGNRIPKQIVEKIKRYNIGYMLFITDIKGIDRNEKVLSLPSMNFIATN